MHFKNKVTVVFCAILTVLIIFWKLPLYGQVPFPGNLLVGRLFPWNSASWEGYPNGVPYKEFIAADAVRQTYPWRELAIKQLKQGDVPGWNPYAFSGSPLLANMQAAPFYPLNFLYVILDFKIGWIIQVLLQPILAIIFTYAFAKNLKMSNLAAFYAGIIFSFSGYMIIWLELNTVGHAALWLPFVLWTLHKAQQRPRYYLLTSFGFIASFFANHLQTTLYLAIICCAYFIFLQHKSKNFRLIGRHIRFFVLAILMSLTVVSVQLIPGYRLLQASPRSGSDDVIFKQFLMPWSHLVTFLIPDYFGNPASNDYFGQDYGEFMAYFGLTALMLVGISSLSKPKTSYEKFFLLLGLISVLFALHNPVAYIPKLVGIPILESSSPARILVLTQFCAAIVGAYGLDKIRSTTKSSLKGWLVLVSVLALMGSINIFKWFTTQDIVAKAQLFVSLKNMIMPVGLFITTSLILFAAMKMKKLNQAVFSWALIGISLIDYSFFSLTYLPFSEFRFMYPEVEPFTFLQGKQTVDRFYGDFTASVTSNTWLPYGVYGVEGYDSLYLERYGELLAAAQNQGQLPDQINRSDANLAANKDDFYRSRLQNLLGVRYILDKTDYPQSDWEPREDLFSPDRYELLWQQGKFKIYENKQALPRVFLVPTYRVIADKQAILDEIFNPTWQPTQSIILESSPESTVVVKKPFETAAVIIDEYDYQGVATIIEYEPTHVLISFTSNVPQFLFLSDSYDPSWKAYLDGNEVPIMRANYAFRGVWVPAGEHILEMQYQLNIMPKIRL